MLAVRSGMLGVRAGMLAVRSRTLVVRPGTRVVRSRGAQGALRGARGALSDARGAPRSRQPQGTVAIREPDERPPRGPVPATRAAASIKRTRAARSPPAAAARAGA
eukprot:gene8517-biopygen11459